MLKTTEDEKEDIWFLDLPTSRVSEKSPLPKRHPQPSAKMLYYKPIVALNFVKVSERT